MTLITAATVFVILGGALLIMAMPAVIAAATTFIATVTEIYLALYLSVPFLGGFACSDDIRNKKENIRGIRDK